MILLNTKNSFSFLIETRHIWAVTAVFAVLICILASFIYIYLYKKKKRFYSNKNIQKSFEDWVGQFLFANNKPESSTLTIPPYFKKQFKSNNKKQAAINILVQTKSNLTGSAADCIIYLYEQLGFRDFSIHKLKHSLWHIKAKGIQELYIMNQSDMLGKIYHYTNNKNKYVRKEAQTAVVHFLGFNGLHFLNVLSKPITDWQQINLMEQLKRFPPTPIKHLQVWLQSNNNTVVLFVLKLAAVYQQFQAYDAVERCLKHTDEKIRMQAAKTLLSITNDQTVNTIIEHYAQETLTNKLNIIQQLAFMAIHTRQQFFFNCLQEEQPLIRLAAAKALEKQGVNVVALLKEKGINESHRDHQLFVHKKSDFSV